ncbi:phosphoglycerate dehydrogenase [uncultured Pseudodesulfovibrio sp.]|uniref:phosphoglycerate dehydrogenase n=1 Tax=uncultured Pseudodesulfovibrio sp. TaxID=2035858 RepID=UPI0029C6D37D|nr:phosphoglycerate dehydrogenase [uncultured Pseudodesulfovibrio sp.]
MSTVLITTSSFGAMDDAPLAMLSEAGYTVVLNPYKRKLTEDEVLGLVKEHDPVGILAGVEPLTRNVMSQGDSLKAIARCGIGMDSVDAGAAEELGLALTNTPDAPTQAVAEITLGAILSMLRGIHHSHGEIVAGRWVRPMGSLLSHQVVGLLGLGRIGRRLAEMLAPFGCTILGHDPFVESCPGVETVSFDDLLSQSDVLSLHLPYSGETHHVMDASALAAMKAGAYLVNYSRGGLVDEEALAAALEDGHLAGAALDSFEEEPYSGPLRNFSNVVLTGHIGSYAREGRIMQEVQAVENLLKSLA